MHCTLQCLGQELYQDFLYQRNCLLLYQDFFYVKKWFFLYQVMVCPGQELYQDFYISRICLFLYQEIQILTSRNGLVLWSGVRSRFLKYQEMFFFFIYQDFLFQEMFLAGVGHASVMLSADGEM